jgi:hypothetical protein
MSLGKRLISTDAAGGGGADGSANFDTVLYEGNGGTKAISSLNFAPDLVWLKNRETAVSHCLFDTIRGAGTTNQLYSDSSAAEGTDTTLTNLVSFDSNGFTLGATSGFNVSNNSGDDYVAWCWKAGGSAVSNTNGTITSSVSANTTGFSIVKYTGNGTAGATIGHGLTLTPSLIIWKNLDATSNWLVYSPLIGSDSEWLYLNLSTSKQDSGSTNEYPTNKVNPTSSVVTVNGAGSSNNINISGQDTIMYCFADIAGYQKIGSYSSDGNNKTISTGFRPRWVMIKSSTSAGNLWVILDSLRTTGTNGKNRIYPNDSYQEDTSIDVSFNATDFTLLTSNGDVNGNGKSYIYLAIA